MGVTPALSVLNRSRVIGEDYKFLVEQIQHDRDHLYDGAIDFYWAVRKRWINSDDFVADEHLAEELALNSPYAQRLKALLVAHKLESR